MSDEGARWMFVTRVLRAIARVNEIDRIALWFYLGCGGEILREIGGSGARSVHAPWRSPSPARVLVDDREAFIRAADQNA